MRSISPVDKLTYYYQEQKYVAKVVCSSVNLPGLQETRTMQSVEHQQRLLFVFFLFFSWRCLKFHVEIKTSRTVTLSHIPLYSDKQNGKFVSKTNCAPPVLHIYKSFLKTMRMVRHWMDDEEV
jgi:hypothetical protein